jgi:hypothetical protein
MLNPSKSNTVVSFLWAIAIVVALVNQVVTAVKASVPEPVAQRERTVQEAAQRLRSSPPANGRTLVLIGLTADRTEDSIYFSYRLQYLIYPMRVDRLIFPWDGLNAESYSDIYICDELMLLRPSDTEWHSGTVYRVRTPISTSKIRGRVD